jgi:hypothetical protein
MPDNIEILDANGNVKQTATDEVGSAHYQKIKMFNGQADSGTPILAGEGGVANALRVALANDSAVYYLLQSIKSSLEQYWHPSSCIDAVSADIVDTTPVLLLAALGGESRYFITSITVTNNGSVGTVVKLRDGLGGTVKHRNHAAEDGGGFSVQFPSALVFSEDTAVYVECETAGANIQVSISGMAFQ